jgi:hypothetical protein
MKPLDILPRLSILAFGVINQPANPPPRCPCFKNAGDEIGGYLIMY